MRVYLDSSALIKRVIAEPQSDPLEDALEGHAAAADSLVSSSLAWIEVARGVRRRIDHESPARLTDAAGDALSGILECPISTPVAALARRLDPAPLRTLDAIHLATAILLDVGLLIAYDERLLAAAEEHGLRTAQPG